jgi:hypothetical protein
MTSRFDRIVRRMLYSENREERGHLYLGRGYFGDYPLCFSDRYFENHLVIRGASGRGKSTLLARILRQLLLAQSPQRLDWLRRRGDRPPRRTSIVIGDLKGEFALFNEIRALCLQLGITFKFFTNQVGAASYLFNPLSAKHLELLTTSQLAQILLEAAGLTYGSGYGKSFFSEGNVKTLLKLLRAFRSTAGSFHELYELLTDPTQRDGVAHISDRELQVGSHVETFLEHMRVVHALNLTENELSGSKPRALARQIQMTDLFGEVQVVYFFLPHALGSVEAPNILRLAIFMLITAAAKAGRSAERNRVVIVCDEAQKLISKNMNTIFEQARSYGTPLVLAHQYYGQLKESHEVDMTQNVDANCVTAIDLGTPDRFSMQRIEDLSPAGRYATLLWQQLASGVGDPKDGREFFIGRAAAQDGRDPLVSVSETRGPLFNVKTIADISMIERSGWFRVQGPRGYTRTPYVTPFIWEHHIPEATYREFAEQSWPAEDAETVTVKLDPFGLDLPAPE